jgi:hypothetical protein
LDTSRHSAFTHVVFFPEKAYIDETIRGGKFCWALIWTTIAPYTHALRLDLLTIHQNTYIKTTCLAALASPFGL